MHNNQAHPNILFIMVDQHRFDYLNCAGAEFIKTPNLDRLAERGIRFENCYTNAPVCAPARIALATGLQAHRFGGQSNAIFLPLSRQTYYQRLRDTGYRIGCVGKLDLAKPLGNNSDGARPACFSWGFTHPLECEGKMHAGQGNGKPFGPYTHYLQQKGLLEDFNADYKKRRQNGYALSAWDSVLPSEDFEDAYIGRQSATWINQALDDYPWHLFVSFVGPHDPFDPPKEYAEQYRNAEMPEAIVDSLKEKPQHIHHRQIDASLEQIAVCRRQYCAAIELIDHQIGEILTALKNRGMMDNTYVIFSSDHGEMLGDHGLFTKGVAYDPSIRVPLIVSGPGIGCGRISTAMIELIDINATICDLAGLEKQEGIDARSFASLLRGENETHREEVFSCLRHFRCVRTSQWKMIENVNGIIELYNMETDPQELDNLAQQQKGTLQEMNQRIQERWLEGKWNR
ncbi:MAG: sulfatase-like hydrolase/transferase [Candidatus Poribacteria bacterium]|nr:sulfatase-like hydrolase/transferase [Candidatus Poribacteria bacterium]